MQCPFTHTPCEYVGCPLWTEERQACRFVEAVDKILALLGTTEWPKTHLTDRELQVLNLIVQGKSNLQISEALPITIQTAKNHVMHIMMKLGAKSRGEAVSFALKRGMVSLH